MDNKQYVLAVLDKLQDDRELAPGLRLIISQYPVSDATLDALIDMFSRVAKTVLHEEKQQKLTTSLEIIKKIKQKEDVETGQIEAELDAMLDQI